MDAHRQLANGMLKSLGLDLVEIGNENGDETVIVLSLGSGMLMAVVDHLVRCYPDVRWLCADLPGWWKLERRAMVIDYAATAYPCYLVLWHSLKSGVGLAEAVKARQLRPIRLWVYVKGVGREETQEVWKSIGARIISTAFNCDPLGLKSQIHAEP